MSIDIKIATGCDNIPGKILRLAHNELTDLTYLNNCMGRGIFPDNMKLAEVSPSYKKSDNLMKGNYRPVSVLTTLSKSYESTMNDQLLGHLATIFNNLLNAFRKGQSCQTYLIKCIEDWKSALEENKHVGVLFTDLSKAFDCLPHTLLLAKLKQRVKIGNAQSKWISLFKGVPQGSILGPLLFNIFINDMYMFMDECTLYNYVDDNSLSCIAQQLTLWYQISSQMATELSSGLLTTGCRQIPKSFNSWWSRAMKIVVEVLLWTIAPLLFLKIM